jgi:AraC-like DNA-binding protein
MVNLNALLAGLAMSQLLFLGSFILINFRQAQLARLLVFFSLCLSGFLAGGIPVISASPVADYLFGSLAVLTPAALWLFAVSFFNDEREIPRYGLGLIVFYYTLNRTDSLLESLGYQTGQAGYYLGYLAPLLVMFGLSLHAIYLGIEGRRADLLEQRRRLRLPFVISMGVVILFTLSFGAVSPLIERLLPGASGQLFLSGVTSMIYATVFAWTLVLNLAMFRLSEGTRRLLQNPQLVFMEPPASQGYPDPRPAAQDRKLLDKLSNAMDQKKLYKERGFTITQLSVKLSASEQRLRTIINQTMGYRNFNQFLNHYRISEAAQLLRDTDEPIANIAMEVGYNSLSAFNKAFKDTHGLTPREFRAQSTNA